jgi:hypothetical protein
MKLLALRCPRCGQVLRPQHDETIVMGCPNCQAIVALDERGVRLETAQFAVPSVEPQLVEWMPFWIFTGRVHITHRETQGGRRSVQKQSVELWAGVTRLFMPAWELPVPEARALGSLLVQFQPEWQSLSPAPPAAFHEITVTPGDALKLLEFVVITIEAERKDWLRDIQFKIETTQAVLWLAPARYDGRSWQLRCA